MKELSIEEKAKAYDSMFERLKDFRFEYRFSAFGDVIEKHFPELEESEDEKMIKYFKDLAPFDKAEELYEKYGFSHKDAIAWFEKQGEQKHQYNSRPRYVGEEELLGTNKQGECPFLKQELIDMGFAFTKDGDLAYPIHKIEKKEFAAWSEEDEAVLDALIRRLEGEDVYVSPHLAAECLKSLKGKVQPQLKQEWSKEDEELYNDLSDTYFYNDEDYPEETYKLMLKRVLDWMTKRAKSLRPQKQWKPSDRELGAILTAIDDERQKGSDAVKELLNIYQQLKKLK